MSSVLLLTRAACLCESTSVRLCTEAPSGSETLSAVAKPAGGVAAASRGTGIICTIGPKTKAPEKLTELLPAGRKGAFALLIVIAILSALLDNIAAALIGGAAAITLFRRKVHIGYLAAMVAASNAGGAGSVIGDTTTTMMWIEGASPVWLF